MNDTHMNAHRVLKSNTFPEIYSRGDYMLDFLNVKSGRKTLLCSLVGLG